MILHPNNVSNDLTIDHHDSTHLHCVSLNIAYGERLTTENVPQKVRTMVPILC